MRIGYMYGFHAYPPKGGNQTHAYEIVKNMLMMGESICVVDDPTMPGVINLCSSNPRWVKRLEELTDVLCVRLDARHLRRWPAFNGVINGGYTKPIFLEINAPSFESLAYSWFGGKENTPENFFRRVRRLIHAKRQWLGIALEERFRKRVGRKLAGAVCISTAIEKYAQHLGVSRTRVLPNGGPLVPKEKILSIRSTAEKQREVFSIFYTGSPIYPWQGLDILTHVMEIAAIREPSFHFNLATNQKIDWLAEKNNVTVSVSLPRESVFRQITLSNACVLLIPDFWWSSIGNYYSPIKLFEYMALAGTVLAPNYGQMREIIKDGVNGYLTDRTPEAVLEKLRIIREDQQKGVDVGWRAWEDVQKRYNWAYVAQETVKFLEEVVGE